MSREEAIQPSGRTVVLADGSYATQSSTAHDISGALGQSQHNVRTLVLGGDFFLGGVVAMTATKLLLRMRAMGGLSGPDFNRVAAQYMLYFVAILRLGENAAVGGPLDADSYERIMLALQALVRCNLSLRH